MFRKRGASAGQSGGRTSGLPHSSLTIFMLQAGTGQVAKVGAWAPAITVDAYGREVSSASAPSQARRAGSQLWGGNLSGRACGSPG